MKKKIRVVEVGPRDGLQNEHNFRFLSEEELVEKRTKFIVELARSGLEDVEAGAFVRPDRVVQMAATGEVVKKLSLEYPELWKKKRFWCLVPNEKGLDNALEAGAKHISVFTATSEKFSEKNVQMSLTKALQVIESIVKRANKIKVRGYISTVWGCPYSGATDPKKAFTITQKLLDMGVEEISLGDTIGVATPKQVSKVLQTFPKKDHLAVHFHDTRGTAIANSLRAIDEGITVIDASAGGLGGCPYAKGASGNLATEDLLYMLHGMDFSTGVDITKVCSAVEELAQSLEIHLPSRYHSAWKSE